MDLRWVESEMRARSRSGCEGLMVCPILREAPFLRESVTQTTGPRAGRRESVEVLHAQETHSHPHSPQHGCAP